MAYETLSKSQEKYDNWRQYGHPDGIMSLKVVELVLPSFMMDESMRPMILTWGFLTICAIVLYTMIKLRSSEYNLPNGISVNSKTNLKEFLFAIYEENDQQQRMQGPSTADLISLYETSENAQAQQQNLPAHVSYASIFDRCQEIVG